MCRFIAYLGEEVLLEEVLVSPKNSLIRQSIHARESPEVPTNGDGFGVGWYTPTVDPMPAVFTSIFPAWNDKNLLNLTAKIASPCFFGHVRAASVGGINPYNCHPFVYEQLMLMHNGDIAYFPAVKRHLRRALDDEFYNWIKGETDSEHLFAFFLQHAKGKGLHDIAVMTEVLLKTYASIEAFVRQQGRDKASYLNVCLSDGQQLLATRYCTDPNQEPNSLHYVVGYGDAITPLAPPVMPDQKPSFVLVASEPLTHLTQAWQIVPKNHLLQVDRERRVTLQAIHPVA